MRLNLCRLAAIVAAATSLLLPASSSATATPEEVSSSLSKGVTYLKGLQNGETGAISGRIVADVKTSTQNLRSTLILGGTLQEPQVRN